MTIPLLSYPPNSQNQRVAGFEVPGEEQPRNYTTAHLPNQVEINELIRAAYRQIFNEQQLLTSNRQVFLESQLRNRQITVREFVRGLLLSETFRRRNYEPNSNYRFVQMCVRRVLGRDIYNDREKLAWSIVLATKGLEGFVDALLTSEEYLKNFGDDTLPYQRRRILPQRSQGDLPFARMPRYGADYRAKLEEIGYFSHEFKQYPWMTSGYRWSWQRPPYPKAYALIAQTIFYGGLVALAGIAIAVALAAWGIISL